MSVGLPISDSRPLIVADGTEGIEGRALLLISALHIAAPSIAHCDIRFFAVRDPVVRAAIEALRWDTNLTVSIIQHGEPLVALAGASLYLAIAFRETSHLMLAAARRLAVPTLIAVQFPETTTASGEYVVPPEAHDPGLYAWHLIRMVGQS
jgi:hypothetical protein